MANEHNLKSADKQSKSEARENGKKGGIASGKARREKKAIRETLDVLMSMPIEDKKAVDIDKIKSFKDIKGKNIIVQEAILVKLVQEGMKGNLRATQLIIELMGEAVKNTENVCEDALSKSLRELAEGLESD